MTKSISAIQEFIYRRTNHGPENSYICNAILRNYGAIKATVLATIMDRCFPKMDEWFVFPHKEQMKILNLSEYHIRECKKFFIQHNIITTQIKGMPAKEWYLFNPEAFQQFVDNLRKTEEAE